MSDKLPPTPNTDTPPKAKVKAKAKAASKPTAKRAYKTRELKPETLSVYVKNYVNETSSLDESSTIEDLLASLGLSIIASAESRIRG